MVGGGFGASAMDRGRGRQLTPREGEHAMTYSSPITVEASERRGLSRAHFQGEVVLLGRNGIWTVMARDISTRGLGVVLDREPDPSTRLVVELFNRIGNFWHRKGLQVVHTTRQGANCWLLGSLFVQEFTGEELRALLD